MAKSQWKSRSRKKYIKNRSNKKYNRKKRTAKKQQGGMLGAIGLAAGGVALATTAYLGLNIFDASSKAFADQEPVVT